MLAAEKAVMLALLLELVQVQELAVEELALVVEVMVLVLEEWEAVCWSCWRW